MAKKKSQNEEMEMEQAYNSIAGRKTFRKPKTGAGKSRPLFIAAVCIAVTAIILGVTAGCLFLGGAKDSDVINHNISVAGVNVGGMTRADAINAVELATKDTYTQMDMVVSIEEHSVLITADQVDAKLNVRKAVDAAVRFQPEKAQDHYVLDLVPFLSLETDAVHTAVEELSQYYDTEQTENKYEIKGTKPADLTQVAEGEGQTLVLTIGTPKYGLNPEHLYNAILNAYSNNYFILDYELEDNLEPVPVDLDAVYSQYCTPAADAQMDKETFEVSDEVYGYEFDLEAAKAQQKEAQYDSVVEIPFNVVVPQVSAEALKAVLFRDVLAEESFYSASSSSRAKNLELACNAINGVVLNPGEKFSYNQVLGKRTPEKGYQYGAAYVGGETIMTIGGGICQVSSNLYYCCLLSDLEIVSRINHGYISGYTPMGMDATVSWGGPEFIFRNNMNYPIRIEAFASDSGRTTVRIVGTDDRDHYVKMTYSVLASYSFETKEEIIDPANNPKNYRDGEVITSPYTGYKVVTYRNRYDKATDTLIESVHEATSVYNKRDKVVAKLVAAETTPPTDTPTTEPSTSPSTEPSTTTEPTTSPTTESTTESTTEATTEPTTEATTEPSELPGSGGNIGEG